MGNNKKKYHIKKNLENNKSLETEVEIKEFPEFQSKQADGKFSKDGNDKIELFKRENENELELKKEINNVDERLKCYECPISHRIMKDPVLAKDGYTYEKIEITKWLAIKNSSPITREELHVEELMPNRLAKDEIDRLNTQLKYLITELKQVND